MANIMQHDALAKTEQGQRNNQKHLNDQWRMGEERRAQLEEEKAKLNEAIEAKKEEVLGELENKKESFLEELKKFATQKINKLFRKKS